MTHLESLRPTDLKNETGTIVWDHGKSDVGYWTHGRSLEPAEVPNPFALTPVDAFFVCNEGDAADLDRHDWSVRVHGEVTQEVKFSFDELADLPQYEVPAWLECAGNGRRLFQDLDGYEISPGQTPWLLNGMGLARWSGPRLRDVLEFAGIEAGANWVSPSGLDHGEGENGPPSMCLPLDKALDDDTLVALTMNGTPLARAHGGPARLLVPGWVGAYSVKWLGGLEVAAHWVPSWRANEFYVHRTPDGEITGPITAHPVKSNLALDYPATLEAGSQQVNGIARSGHGTIVEVKWRLNGGEWRLAELGTAVGRWAWMPFFFEVNLPAGSHQIETCATDAVGNTQPAVQALHQDGVLWNAITRHPIAAD